jgi:outer membrane immunogenic protein
MRRVSVLIAAAVLSSSAFAADLPSKVVAQVPYQPLPMWAGFYVGVNGGYGWMNEDQTIRGANAIGSAIVASGFVPSSSATRGGGGLFGATLGYNWQFGQVVAGAEADFDWSGIKGSGTQRLGIGPFSLTTVGTSKLNWVGSVRGRAGYLVTPTTLLYGTGGLAFGQAETNTAITLVGPGPFNAAAIGNNSTTKVGWTIGAGLEQQFLQRWSIKSEYRYTDLGSIGGTFGTTIFKTPIAFVNDQKLAYHTFLVGVNYRFYP